MKTVVVLALLLACALCSCPVGTRKKYRRTGTYCSECERGFYCPGDDSQNRCDEFSYSPYASLGKCLPCKRPSPDRKICLPNDAPSEVLFFDLIVNPLEPPQSINVTLDKPLVIASEYNGPVVFSASQSINSESPLTVYVHTKSANPSEKDYEYKLVGRNATYMLPQNHSKPENSYGNGNFTPVFFKVIPSKPTKVLIGQVHYHPLKYTLHSEDDPLPAISKGQTIFLVKGVNKKSKITLSVKPRYDYGKNLGGFIYWSSNKDNKFPSVHDHEAKVPFVNGAFNFTVIDQGLSVIFAAFPIYTQSSTDFEFDVGVNVQQL